MAPGTHPSTAGTPARTRFMIVALAAGIIVLSAMPTYARVVGDIIGIGYRASGEGGVAAGPKVRVGSWTPVWVSLGLENQVAFDGALRIKQRDPDGDFCCDEVPVHLRADSGPQKTYELYVVAGISPSTSDYLVTLVDEDGQAIELVSGGKVVRQLEPPAELEHLPDRHCLILALTSEDRAIGKIGKFASSEEVDKLWRPVHLAHITPSRMPSHWIGLEMVDSIVWDEADATALTRPQLVALIDWVRHGGKLLIASAKTADTLVQSDLLEPLLPVDIGQVVSTRRLPKLRHRLLGIPPDQDRGYFRSIAVAYCTLRDEPGVYEVLREEDTGGTAATAEQDGATDPAAGSVLVARRRVDRGQVTFVGAALNDLLSGKCLPEQFFRLTLGLRRTPTGTDEIYSGQQLFPNVQDTVGFHGKGGAFMVLAFLFAMLYLGVSTFGVWSFLKSRGWVRHSWLAFSAVAVATGVLSVLGVQTVRGIGQELHQLTIVDLEAGRSDARATCYFGLTTGTHTTLDVWMPSDYPRETEPDQTHCYLKPMPELRDDGLAVQCSFTDPGQYRLMPASAEVADVPVRATLKRFEGHWQGVLQGQVQGSIRIRRNAALVKDALLEEEREVQYEDIFVPGSTITNKLGVDLETCYIFQATKNVYDGRNFLDTSPRAGTDTLGSYVYAHQIRGGIKDGETVDLAQRIYTDAKGKALSHETWLKRNSLRSAQHDWASALPRLSVLAGGRKGGTEFRVTQPFANALLLLTTLADYDPLSIKGAYAQAGTQLLDERCRHLDLSNLLTKDVVILVGFAGEPGPVKLCTRKGNRPYRPVKATKATTIYRVLIPVEG